MKTDDVIALVEERAARAVALMLDDDATFPMFKAFPPPAETIADMEALIMNEMFALLAKCGVTFED